MAVICGCDPAGACDYCGGKKVWGKFMLKQRLMVTVVTTLVCAMGSGSALASGDYSPPKVYALIQGDIDNNLPFLAPTNDTRATLLLLLADAGLARPHIPRGYDPAAKPDPNGAKGPETPDPKQKKGWLSFMKPKA